MGKSFCSWVTWPDLVTWPQMALDRNFHKSCDKDGGKVGENPAALRDAVFSLSSKNLRGAFKRPSSRARVNGSLVTHKIWTQSAQPFARYGRRVCTCARADALHVIHVKHLSNGSLVTHKIWTQSAQPFGRYGRRSCTCARADSPTSDLCKSNR